MPRAFFGIPMPGPARRALSLARDAILDSEPAWAREKWVEPANLHVTTLFLGEITGQGLADAADAVSAALADMAPFLVSIDTIRAVPSLRGASMLWAVPSAASDPMSELASRLASACAPLRPPARDRGFTTHVTMCRARDRRRISPDTLAAAASRLRSQGDPTTVSVGAVTLFTSTLTMRGPIYEQYAVVPLSG